MSRRAALLMTLLALVSLAAAAPLLSAVVTRTGLPTFLAVGAELVV